MNILHVITSLRTGGAERLMIDILPKLKERGHSTSLLLFDGTRTPFYKQLEAMEIPIYALAMGSWSMYNPLLLFRLNEFLKGHRFDIIHTHNTPCQLFVAAVAEGNARYVTTEHNTNNRRRRWAWYRSIDRWMYGRYDYVVCVSKDVQNNLLKSLGQSAMSAKTSVIPNGIDTARYANAKADETLERRYKGKHLIVMVAAFRPQKDQATLIRAMALLPKNYCLMLVGDGECRAQCEALTKTLGIASRVSFEGICSDIPGILGSAEVVVMSSCYEGLSLSSLEGMASGRPFIASDVDGLHDIVSGAGLLFPLYDERELSELIRRCCEDKVWSIDVGNRCRERAMRYGINKMVDRYENVYMELTKQ